MSGPEAGRAGAAGPVLAGILAVTTAEEVLRLAFDQARLRGVPVRVLAAGHAPEEEPELREIAGRWAGKYPEVPFSVTFRAAVDPAISLAAAARGCGLAVLCAPPGARAGAVIRAVAHRAACPILVA